MTPSLLWGMWGLESWLVSQGLMLAGAAAISVPIIIHLLHRRKFQIVEWAAMDFLLEADRKNRRRIQLEDFLLLLLRCLAVFLAGLLLARPFLPSSLTGGLLQGN
ncbi:MAG: BatA domain-containing protein, partial [Pirellulales bacterium]